MCFLLSMRLYPCQHDAMCDQYSACDDARRYPGWTIQDAIRCPRMREVKFLVPRCRECGPVPATLHNHIHTHIQPTTRISPRAAGRPVEREHRRTLRCRDGSTVNDDSVSNHATTGSPSSSTFAMKPRRTSLVGVDRHPARGSRRSPIERLLGRLPRITTSQFPLVSPSRSWSGNEQGSQFSSLPSSRTGLDASSLSVPTSTDSLSTIYEASLESNQHTSIPNIRRSRRRARHSRTPRSLPKSRNEPYPFPTFEPTQRNNLPTVQESAEHTSRPVSLLDMQDPRSALRSIMALEPSTTSSVWRMPGHRIVPRTEEWRAVTNAAENDGQPEPVKRGGFDRPAQDASRTFTLPTREKLRYSNAHSRSDGNSKR